MTSLDLSVLLTLYVSNFKLYLELHSALSVDCFSHSDPHCTAQFDVLGFQMTSTPSAMLSYVNVYVVYTL